MSVHFIGICQHGFVYTQCRCASDRKQVRRVDCGGKCKVAELERQSETPNTGFDGDLKQNLRDLCGRCHKRPCTVCAAVIRIDELEAKVAEANDIFDDVIHAATCHQGDDTSTARAALGRAHSRIREFRKRAAREGES